MTSLSQPSPIEFYFDFSSPYGYFAAEEIDAIAARHGREVSWRAYLLGVAFKTTGMAPLASIPLKNTYMRRDLVRSARLLGLPYREPSRFPIVTLTPARAFYWAEAHDPSRSHALARDLYRAFFVSDIDISDMERTLDVCEANGFVRDEARTGISAQDTKDRLRTEVDGGLAKGVFGSPYMIVDGEPFWGSDRLEQLERWLESGGW